MPRTYFPVDDDNLAGRWLLPALLGLLVAVWLGGGVTVDDTAIDEWLQLLALPVLVLGVAALVQGPRLHGSSRVALVVAALIALLPAMQLLMLPDAMWASAPWRAALGKDLASAGVVGVTRHVTLGPHATEAGLWAMLPAMAGFLAGLALTPQAHRRAIQALVLLVLANLLFAFFQAGLPRDSGLRLYQDFDAGFGGLLVNTNHHGTALLVGMALAIGLAVEARHRPEQHGIGGHKHWWYAALAGLFLLAVPLSTSRAAVAIALPTLALALIWTGAITLRRIGRSRRATVIAVGLGVLALVGVWSIRGWMAVDEAEELRHIMALATFETGKVHAPWGSGIGSFVPLFEQTAPTSLLQNAWVNHAHNEYAQWWLTGGIMAMIVLLAALATLGFAGGRLLHRQHDRALPSACWVAVCAVLAHSWVDYPLRTLALMTTTAVLAGIAVNAATEARNVRDSSGRGAPLQPA